MIRILYALLFVSLMVACKDKKKSESDPDKQIISAVALVKKDIADVDTSIYSIIKVETRNGVTDTVDVPREDFHKYAKDFTEMPDITSDDLSDDYEESKDFDTLTNKVNISYITKNPDLEIKHQMMNILPIPGNESRVETIYVYRIISDEDSTVQKKMTWETGKWFQVVTITQKENAPEEIRKLKLIWAAGPMDN